MSNPLSKPQPMTPVSRRPVNYVAAGRDATLTLNADGMETKVPLYSDEGFALAAALWTKLSAEYRRAYAPSWLGIPVVQWSEDIVAMQELIWRLRPDLIVECGIAHGGSLIFYASLMELIGKGRVLGVDVDIRQHNRVAIEAHPFSHRISLYEGSSIAETTLRHVAQQSALAERTLIILDSNHTASHVAEELRLYCELVTPGSYLVVMDGALGLVHDVPSVELDDPSDSPLTAIDDFLDWNTDFTIDPHFTRFGITASPNGFLRRKSAEEHGR